jgi:4-hydroxy-tetrahydrodipicolinate synthase
MLSVGAEGAVSVVANLVPREVAAMVEAFQAGRVDEARRRHARLFPLSRDLLSLAPNPVPVKAALSLLGRCRGEVRLPLCPLDEQGRGVVRRGLLSYGLLTEST